METRQNEPGRVDLQGSLFGADFVEDSAASWHTEIMDSLGIIGGPAWPDRFGVATRTWLADSGHAPIKTLSLFSGGGGLDLGFHDSGFDIVQMVELEQKYVDTLAANSRPDGLLEGSEPLCIDIREYEPDASLDVDFVIGGPPCQTFSAAGRRAAGVSGTTDSRGTLFEEYVRILHVLRPKGFLFENVYGITGAQSGAAWRQIQSAFEEAGYKTRYRILDAADYGVPQHRERLFIVGVRDGDFRFPTPTHGPDSIGNHPFYTAEEAVSGADTTGVEFGIGGRYGQLLDGIPPGLNYSFYTHEMGHPSPIFSWRSKFSDFLYKADPEAPVRTLKAQGGQYTGPFSWENRKFSISELKRLQTIPDEYEIVGGKQAAVEQIGNSVPPQMARALALSILNGVMGVELPFEMRFMAHDKTLGFRKRKRFLTKRYRENARTAISNLRPAAEEAQNLEAVSRYEKYTRYLSEDFLWSEEASSRSAKMNLRFVVENSDAFIIATHDNTTHVKAAYGVTINPTSEDDWRLGARNIRLIANDFASETFTALWKAFEEKILELYGIADLVQLSGYYQYRPKVKSSMEFFAAEPTNDMWRVVQSVVSGSGIANQLPGDNFAMLWGIEADSVLPSLHALRRMGYEVRSHNTNPQITEGEFLIPYSFPTLTPRSVQLRKKL